MSKYKPFILVAILILGVGGFYALGLQKRFSFEYIVQNLAYWKEQTEAALPLAIALYFAVYVLVTALSLPIAALLTLLGGALFGRWLGTGIVSVAANTGATLAFLSSRFLLADWVEQKFGQRLQAINRGVERDGAYYLFTLRLVPAVPFFLINLAMGLTPMRWSTFALVSWLGMLPGTFLYVNAGTELSQLKSASGILTWPVLGSLVLLGIFPLIARKILQRRRPIDAGSPVK